MPTAPSRHLGNEVAEELAPLPARHVLVILDACKSGFALSEKFKFRSGGQGGTIAELAGRVSRQAECPVGRGYLII